MILALVGRQGQGKTICMLFLALYLRDKLKRDIHTNIPNVKTVNTPLLTSFTQMWKIRDSILMLDELHHDFDSRSFAKNANRTQWISQMRKMRNYLLYNTQQFHKVDRRLRDETHYVFVASNKGNGKHKLEMYDACDYDMGNMIVRKTLNINVSSLFDYYDTHQLIFDMNE